jgi:hypothetical protein
VLFSSYASVFYVLCGVEGPSLTGEDRTVGSGPRTGFGMLVSEST